MSKTEVWSETELDKICLVVYLNNSKQLLNYVLDSETFIGRKTATSAANVQIDSPIVSRNQGRIYFQDGFVFYEDLESANGTYINGKLLGRESEDKKTRCVLKVGDVLRIDHRNLQHPNKDAIIMVVSGVPDGKITHKNLILGDGKKLSVGRNNDDLNFENNMISEKHAVFSINGKHAEVTDCNSTNGVFVNNKKIDFSQTLFPLDVIRIVDYIFIFTGEIIIYFTTAIEGKRLIISIEERSVRNFVKKQVLLQDINLSIEQGDMVMLLGGSGAGKTTFFNAVMGYEKAKGKILHDEVDVYKEYSKVKHDIGFVPQQDLLRLEDTVYQTLKNAAMVKMPVNSTHEEHNKRIDQVLENLGLTREKDSLVRKLSGGQRKRLSIAVELVADPSLFFLDEPDSGLDGIMARSLMSQLRTIANDGKIVMVITHAPDRVRELFDKVIVLAKGEKDNIGHMSFYGAIDEALQFFETDSLEGVVKRINRIDEGGDGMSDYYIEKYRNYRGEK